MCIRDRFQGTAHTAAKGRFLPVHGEVMPHRGGQVDNVGDARLYLIEHARQEQPLLHRAGPWVCLLYTSESGIYSASCNCPVPDDQVKENTETVQLMEEMERCV